jgi:hypothetical protein
MMPPPNKIAVETVSWHWPANGEGKFRLKAIRENDL